MSFGPVGFLADDPWYWSIEELAANLFRDDGPFQEIGDRRAWPDPIAFADQLRIQEMPGIIFLTEVDRTVLREDFDLRTAGKVGAVLHVIASLRIRSRKYQTERAQPPRFEVSDPKHLGTFSADHQSPSKLPSAAISQISTLNPLRKRKASSLLEEERQNLEGYPPTPQSREVDHGDLDFSTVSATIRTTQLNNNPRLNNLNKDVKIRGLDYSNDHTDEAARLNYGEEATNLRDVKERGGHPIYYVFDETGKKRKRLQLVNQGQAPEPYPMPALGSSVAATVLERIADHPDDTNASTFEDAEPGALFNGRNKTTDFTSLEKWYHSADAEEILPVYGDSSSEDDDELKEWLEIEKENCVRKEIIQKRPSSSKRSYLCNVETAQIIEDAITETAQAWKSSQVSSADRKAWRLWTQSRRDSTWDSDIKALALRVDSVNKRIAKQKKTYLEASWSSASELRRVCKAMQPSIHDREEWTWQISVLELRSAPPKPLPFQGTKSLRLKPNTMEQPTEDTMDVVDNDPLEGALVISGESDVDDFIDDEGSGGPGHVDYGEDGDDEMEVVDMIDSLSHNRTRAQARSASTVSPDTKSTNSSVPEGSKPGSESRESPIVESTSQSKPSTLLPRLRQILFTKKKDKKQEIIDLTLSDSESPTLLKTPAPKTKEEELFFAVADRSAKVEFKVPTTLRDSVNLDTGSSASEEVPLAPTKWPKYHEVSSIAGMDVVMLEERQDRPRLLIWIIAHASPGEREEAFRLTDGLASKRVRAHVWDCLRFWQEQTHPMTPYLVRTYSSEEIETFMLIAEWFVSWVRSLRSSRRDPVALDKLGHMLRDTDGFEDFYKHLSYSLKHYIDDDFRQFDDLSERLSVNKESLPPFEISDDFDTSNVVKAPKRRRQHGTRVKSDRGAAQHPTSSQVRKDKWVERAKTIQSQQGEMGEDAQEFCLLPINPGVSPEEDTIFLNSKFRSIFPHQVEGVQFMWKEVVKANEGCLLAHTMGLGKTMQVIVLLVTIAEASKSARDNIRDQVPVNLRKSRTLILVPPSLLENWEAELNHWMPTPHDIYAGEVFKVGALSFSGHKKAHQILMWEKKGGVLLLSLNYFSGLLKIPKSEEQAKVASILLDRSSIIVIDEAHRIKSPATNLSKAVQLFKSKNRIALTGSPLANHLDEYFSLFEWIAPNYLGTRSDFRSKYVRPIQQGMYQDSSQAEQRKGLKMLAVLKGQLEPKVSRADITVLGARLPAKTEFLIRVPLTAVQEQAYQICVNYMLTGSDTQEPRQMQLWVWLTLLRLLCNHPKSFLERLNDPGTSQRKKSHFRKTKAADVECELESEEQQDEDLLGEVDERVEEPIGRLGLSPKLVQDQNELLAPLKESLSSIHLSHKMEVLVVILEYAQEAGDKILIFSHNLRTLNFVEELLKERKWSYKRLDGDTAISSRHKLTKDFNTGDFMICLISTRAGGEGLNLYGANRVVILDDHFNPIYEEQAIGRAYRFGQLKHVYVYRLYVGGTFEDVLRNKSLFKLQLIDRVVDKKTTVRRALRGAKAYLFKPQLCVQKDINGFGEKDVLVLARILAKQNEAPIIRSVDLRETFHQEVEEPLDEQEKREAEEMAQEERLRRANPAAYLGRATERQPVEELMELNFPELRRGLDNQGLPENQRDRSPTPEQLLPRDAHNRPWSGGNLRRPYEPFT